MKIGILGGIGPQATAVFYSRLIASFQRGGITSNADFPQIFINSIPAPEIISSKPYLAAYRRGIEELDSLQPDFIVMVCNTVHSYYDELTAGLRAPVLDLRKFVRRQMGSSRVTVLSTGMSSKANLFGLPNLAPVSAEDQQILDSAIFNFNTGRKDQSDVFAIAAKYSKSAQVLVACTELSQILAGKGYSDTFEMMHEMTLKAAATFK